MTIDANKYSFVNRFDLSGRTACITGGAGLLGPHHAHALLECGSKVALVDINIERGEKISKELNKKFGADRCIPFKADVSDRNEIEDLQNSISKSLGPVSILINNAAIDAKVTASGSIIQTSRFENFSLEQWNREIAVSLTGSMVCSQVFGSAMKAQGGGVILQISSDLSVIAPDQRIYRKEGLREDQQPVKPVTYSVIKTALVGLTRYLAAYWANANIRVNCLSPGGVFNGQPKDFVERLSALIPLGRMAEVHEYRQTVQFLCSDASSYMTGQNIVVDGGRSIL